jgi:hypothetical protein
LIKLGECDADGAGEVVPPERFSDVPDRWEVVSLPHVHPAYLVYQGQNQTKARFCFQAVKDDKDNLDVDLLDELESQPSKTELGIKKQLHVDVVKRVESARRKVNGVDVLWLHFTYSSSGETGDVIMTLLRKGGSMFMALGTFSSPMYVQLQNDITAVLDSIEKQ